MDRGTRPLSRDARVATGCTGSCRLRTSARSPRAAVTGKGVREASRKGFVGRGIGGLTRARHAVRRRKARAITGVTATPAGSPAAPAVVTAVAAAAVRRGRTLGVALADRAPQRPTIVNADTDRARAGHLVAAATAITTRRQGRCATAGLASARSPRALIAVGAGPVAAAPRGSTSSAYLIVCGAVVPIIFGTPAPHTTLQGANDRTCGRIAKRESRTSFRAGLAAAAVAVLRRCPPCLPSVAPRGAPSLPVSTTCLAI